MWLLRISDMRKKDLEYGVVKDYVFFSNNFSIGWRGGEPPQHQLPEKCQAVCPLIGCPPSQLVDFIHPQAVCLPEMKGFREWDCKSPPAPLLFSGLFKGNP